MKREPGAGRLVVGVRGIGVQGPGLAGWSLAQALLREPGGWSGTPTVLPVPARLPPAERRRAGAGVKLSLAVAEQACAEAGIDPGTLATVFTASSGDSANCHALCEALASAERAVSPTRFTNSVHNAAAGYWHIATACRAPSTSLCAHDGSFAAGLLEAASQSAALARPVLLVAGDVPYPEPLHGVRPLPDAFGVALLLDAGCEDPAHGLLSLGFSAGPLSRCEPAALDALRRGVPAARSLPLLQALAHGSNAVVVVEYLEGLAIEVRVQAAGARP